MKNRFTEKSENLESIYLKLEVFGKSEEQEDISKLISYFGHPVWAVRKKAAELVIAKGDKIIPIISQIVFLDYNMDEDTLYWCIRCAGDVGGNAVSAILIPLLNHERLPPSYKSFIIHSLGKTAKPEIFDLLIKLLSDPAWAIRREAAAVLQGFGEAVLGPIKTAFSSGNDDVRYWSVKILGHIMGRESISFFRNLLKSPKKEIRYYAATALGEIDDEEALMTLIDLFSDESWLVRAQVAEIFEKQGKKSIPFLKKVFEKGNSDARFQTIRLMGKIMGDEARSFIEKILFSKETEMKFYALSALSESPDPEAIELITSAFTDNVWLVRKHAAEALARMGERSFPTLERLLKEIRDENLRYWSLFTLSMMGAQGAVRLTSFFPELSKKERKTVIGFITEMSDSSLHDLLFIALEDSEWPVRSEAAKILSNNIEAIANRLPEKYVGGTDDMRYWLSTIANEKSDFLLPLFQERLLSLSTNTIDTLKLRTAIILLILAMNIPASQEILQAELKQDAEDIEYFLESLKEVPLTAPLFKGLLKFYCDGDEVVQSLFKELIVKHLFAHFAVVSEILQENFYAYSHLLDLAGEAKNKNSLQFLQSFLPLENKDIKSKIFKLISSFDSLETTYILLDHYKTCSDNDKLLLLSTPVGELNRKYLKAIIDRFRMATPEECHGYARLLVAWGETQVNYYEGLLASSNDPKIKQWITNVILHLKGEKYLE